MPPKLQHSRTCYHSPLPHSHHNMSLQSICSSNIPNQATPLPPQVPSSNQDPSSIYRSTRPLQRLVDRKLKAILRRRVVQHFCKVEQRHQGKPRRSIRLYINHCNSGTPPDKPLCPCVLFGKENYFLDEERKTNGPTDGFRIVVF